MKTIKITLPILLFMIINNTHGEIAWDSYEAYMNNVANVCKKSDYYMDTANAFENQPVVLIEDYLEPEEYKSQSFLDRIKLKYTFKSDDKNMLPFVIAKAKYRYDQNEIYKCGVYEAQLKSIKEVEQLLQGDTTGSLKDRLGNKIKTKIERTKALKEAHGCISDKSLGLFNKKILDHSTYEYCKYSYYLKFLEYYYADIKNVFGISYGEQEEWKNKKIDISSIASKREEILNKIKIEREHTSKMYDYAFDAYIQYESYLHIHILLELIKEDFMVLRTKLYQTLNPINQVVYKIINAMSK